jgi:hypothetical protein
VAALQRCGGTLCRIPTVSLNRVALKSERAMGLKRVASEQKTSEQEASKQVSANTWRVNTWPKQVIYAHVIYE